MIAQYDLKVGDKIYPLKYNNKALRTLEKQLGMPITKIGRKMQEEEFGVNELTEILRVGLIHWKPDVTIDEADEIIDEVGLQKASEAIGKAFELAFAPPKGTGEQKN
ncbi:GTA-gp10 family protein [Thermoanaerobacterium thermosaccharolyticum]|uniref:GTA-gp10 family protein n=1 Tax=Thermoanaerobacterium thermosaccharolyticum TaxID=1517 RepID=UPI003DA92B42